MRACVSPHLCRWICAWPMEDYHGYTRGQARRGVWLSELSSWTTRGDRTPTPGTPYIRRLSDRRWEIVVLPAHRAATPRHHLGRLTADRPHGRSGGGAGTARGS